MTYEEDIPELPALVETPAEHVLRMRLLHALVHCYAAGHPLFEFESETTDLKGRRLAADLQQIRMTVRHVDFWATYSRLAAEKGWR